MPSEKGVKKGEPKRGGKIMGGALLTLRRSFVMPQREA